MKLPIARKLLYSLLMGLFILFSFKGYTMVNNQYKTNQDLPRNEELSLFNPHRPSFTCVIEADKVPPLMHKPKNGFSKRRH